MSFQHNDEDISLRCRGCNGLTKLGKPFKGKIKRFIGNKVTIKSSGLTQHLKSKPRCYQHYEVTGLISQSGVIDLLSSVVLSSNTTNSQEAVSTENNSLPVNINRKRAKETINHLGLTLTDNGPASLQVRKVMKTNEVDICSSLDNQVLYISQVSTDM